MALSLVANVLSIRTLRIGGPLACDPQGSTGRSVAGLFAPTLRNLGLRAGLIVLLALGFGLALYAMLSRHQ